ncbi:carbohydrate ABC transporter permease [Paenibacillus sp. FSL H7-0331]|uniref:carbohydrate ABC transporter permease n=1 Tax=Paenibacillus sp. FSL H7-0331 TaxID=1920421 RepID=UPI00096C696C|nr:carbohydrate ABC transporter permease [Paenibacillus sp. FSL H7-0331]OMF15845.1 sugar ABC transporter permease [Paenibacillus sp. FSL H7-0331]
MKKTNFKSYLFYLMAILVLIIQVYPIIWIFLSSLKNSKEFSSSNPLNIPIHPTFDNYVNAWNGGHISVYFMNSLIVAVVSIIGIVVLSATAAFAMEKLQFRGSGKLLIYFLGGIMVPIQVTLIPLFMIYKELDILNTHASLILPQVGFALPVSIYLFVSFYKYIPGEVIEAAIMDGCNVYRIFLKIILPMSRNTIVTVVAMNSIFIWNEFIFANTFINDASLKTIPVGLKDFVQVYGLTDWGSTFAAISLTTLPTLLVYFFFNKSVISGMAAGATKG